jgi:hypothetical protein
MFTSSLLSSCDRFFVRYISSLAHHVKKSFVRSGLHVLCTITFVPAQQDGSVRSKCHKHAANTSSSLLKIGEGHLHCRVSSSIHPSTYLPTYLCIHPLLAPPPSPPPTTMSQPHPQNPTTIAEHVVNTELCKKEQVCPSRTTSPPPLPRESSHRLTYPPSTPISLASMEHTRLPMELSVYAPTTVLAPAPLRKDQPRCVRGAYHPRHATRMLLRGVNIALVVTGSGVTFGSRREAVGFVLVSVRRPPIQLPIPLFAHPLPYF